MSCAARASTRAWGTGSTSAALPGGGSSRLERCAAHIILRVYLVAFIHDLLLAHNGLRAEHDRLARPLDDRLLRAADRSLDALLLRGNALRRLELARDLAALLLLIALGHHHLGREGSGGGRGRCGGRYGGRCGGKCGGRWREMEKEGEGGGEAGLVGLAPRRVAWCR